MIHPDDSVDPDDTIYPEDPFKTIEIDEPIEADPYQTIEIDETAEVEDQGDPHPTMDIHHPPQHPSEDGSRARAAADQEVQVEEDEFLTIHPEDNVDPISEESSDPHDTWEPE